MSALMAGVGSPDGPIDVLADLGRLPPGTIATGGWPDRSDEVVVVLRSDTASVMQVAERAPEILGRWGERVGLVVIDSGRHEISKIEQFIGIAVVAELPFDRGAAAVAAGERAGGRRLARSLLTPAASRLAGHLARLRPTRLADSPGLQEPSVRIDHPTDRPIFSRLTSHRPKSSPSERIDGDDAERQRTEALR
jgi:hypothetical protein